MFTKNIIDPMMGVFTFETILAMFISLSLMIIYYIAICLGNLKVLKYFNKNYNYYSNNGNINNKDSNRNLIIKSFIPVLNQICIAKLVKENPVDKKVYVLDKIKIDKSKFIYYPILLVLYYIIHINILNFSLIVIYFIFVIHTYNDIFKQIDNNIYIDGGNENFYIQSILCAIFPIFWPILIAIKIKN